MSMKDCAPPEVVSPLKRVGIGWGAKGVSPPRVPRPPRIFQNQRDVGVRPIGEDKEMMR